MKVLKLGIDPAKHKGPWVWRGICTNCKTEVEAEKGEVICYRSDHFWTGCACPLCEDTILVRKVPKDPSCPM